MTDKNFRQLVDSIDQKISNLREEKNRIIIEKQSSCTHLHIIEGRYDGRTPPFRVCIECGYAEEGWGTGYWGLRNSKYPIGETSKEIARQYILKFYGQPDFPEHAVNKAKKEMSNR